MTPTPDSHTAQSAAAEVTVQELIVHTGWVAPVRPPFEEAGMPPGKDPFPPQCRATRPRRTPSPRPRLARVPAVVDPGREPPHANARFLPAPRGANSCGGAIRMLAWTASSSLFIAPTALSRLPDHLSVPLFGLSQRAQGPVDDAAPGCCSSGCRTTSICCRTACSSTRWGTPPC